MASDIPVEAQALGTPTAEHLPSAARQRGNRISGIVLIVIGLGGVLVGILLSTATDDSFMLCFSAAGLIGALLGVLLLVASRRQDQRVLVFPEGLSYTKRGKTNIIRWDDVASFSYNVTRQRRAGTTHVYTVRLTDERKYVFSDALANIVGLGNTIREETTRRILPRVLEAYNADETISFGKLSISKAGITKGKQTLPWDQVKGVKVERGFVSIQKEGKRPRWASVGVAETPNVFVFLALAEQIVGVE